MRYVHLLCANVLCLFNIPVVTDDNIMTMGWWKMTCSNVNYWPLALPANFDQGTTWILRSALCPDDSTLSNNKRARCLVIGRYSKDFGNLMRNVVLLPIIRVFCLRDELWLWLRQLVKECLRSVSLISPAQEQFLMI